MTLSKHIFEEERQLLMAITSIGVEVKALVIDEDGQMVPVDDPHVERLFYMSVFQAWADNKIDGTAEQIFDTIQEALAV